MTTYKFTKQRDTKNEFDTTTVEITCETAGLDELIECFEEFLAACGFGKKQIQLDVIDDERVDD